MSLITIFSRDGELFRICDEHPLLIESSLSVCDFKQRLPLNSYVFCCLLMKNYDYNTKVLIDSLKDILPLSSKGTEKILITKIIINSINSINKRLNYLISILDIQDDLIDNFIEERVYEDEKFNENYIKSKIIDYIEYGFGNTGIELTTVYQLVTDYLTYYEYQEFIDCILTNKYDNDITILLRNFNRLMTLIKSVNIINISMFSNITIMILKRIFKHTGDKSKDVIYLLSDEDIEKFDWTITNDYTVEKIEDIINRNAYDCSRNIFHNLYNIYKFKSTIYEIDERRHYYDYTYEYSFAKYHEKLGLFLYSFHNFGNLEINSIHYEIYKETDIMKHIIDNIKSDIKIDDKFLDEMFTLSNEETLLHLLNSFDKKTDFRKQISYNHQKKVIDRDMKNVLIKLISMKVIHEHLEYKFTRENIIEYSVSSLRFNTKCTSKREDNIMYLINNIKSKLYNINKIRALILRNHKYFSLDIIKLILVKDLKTFSDFRKMIKNKGLEIGSLVNQIEYKKDLEEYIKNYYGYQVYNSIFLP